MAGDWVLAGRDGASASGAGRREGESLRLLIFARGVSAFPILRLLRVGCEPFITVRPSERTGGGDVN